MLANHGKFPMMGRKMMIKTGWMMKHQRGAALVISLIMLLLMTLVGVTAMQVTTVQEKMVSNSRDLNVAFQAAETALKRGEEYIKQIQMQQINFTQNCTIAGGGNIGLCRPTCESIASSSRIAGVECWVGGGNLVQWRNPLVSWATNSLTTLRYGAGTDNGVVGTDAIPAAAFPATFTISQLPLGSVARQPRYMIEDITPQGGGGLGTGQQTINSGWYRITAQGYGQAQGDDNEPLSRVMLQSVFKKRS